MRLQGLTPERPLTHDLFASTLEALDAHGRAGRHLRPGRRDVPRPAVRRARRQDRRDRRAAVRRARPGGPGRRPDLRRRRRSSTRPGWAPTAGSAMTTRRASCSSRPARSIVDPRLDVFRDFVNSLDVDQDAEGRGS